MPKEKKVLRDAIGFELRFGELYGYSTNWSTGWTSSFYGIITEANFDRGMVKVNVVRRFRADHADNVHRDYSDRRKYVWVKANMLYRLNGYHLEELMKSPI